MGGRKNRQDKPHYDRNFKRFVKDVLKEQKRINEKKRVEEKRRNIQQNGNDSNL
jgi:hypothetical protein